VFQEAVSMAQQSLVPFGGEDPFLSLHREVNRLFDDVFRGSRSFAPRAQTASPSVFSPSMDVAESDNEIRLCVDLPGVEEKDIDVSLDHDVLTIRGEKKFEQERGDKKENYHLVERSYGAFQRSLRLPFMANPDEVKASFDKGVLTVTVPKSAQQSRAKRIQIQGGQAAGAGGQQPGQIQAPAGETSGGEGQATH
jgi:HSP20 family protein